MIKFLVNTKWIYYCLGLIALILFHSCSEKFISRKDARQDAKEFKESKEAREKIKKTVYPFVETEPVISEFVEDDSADDPAIWYNKLDPEKSIIFGSNKTAGIHSYDLGGNEMQFVPCGKINNIDVRTEVLFDNRIISILGGSNRTDNAIDLFEIDAKGKIKKEPLGKIQLGNYEPYGFCLGKSKDNLLNIYVNNKEGELFHFKVDSKGDLSNMKKRFLKFETQLEGMVVDDDKEQLYIGEEEKGIWLCDAFNLKSKYTEFLSQSTEANPYIRFDIEGLALLGDKYLLASIQGNFSYAVFNRINKKYITSFKINGKGSIDGVEETDGIEIMNSPLDNYANGLLVVQDGYNYQDSILLRQNFKVIDLKEVIEIIE